MHYCTKNKKGNKCPLKFKLSFIRSDNRYVDNIATDERGEHVFLFSLERKMHYLLFTAFMHLTLNLALGQ